MGRNGVQDRVYGVVQGTGLGVERDWVRVSRGMGWGKRLWLRGRDCGTGGLGYGMGWGRRVGMKGKVGRDWGTGRFGYG